MTIWKDLNADPSVRWPMWRRVRWGLSFGTICGGVVFLVSLLFTDWTNGLVYERAGPWELGSLMSTRLIGMPLGGAIAGALLPFGARRFGGYLLGPIVFLVIVLPSRFVTNVYQYSPVPRWQVWIGVPFAIVLAAIMGQQLTEPLRGKPIPEIAHVPE